MRVGIYADLPKGGAKVAIDSIYQYLSKIQDVSWLPLPKFEVSAHRLIRDFQLRFLAPNYFKRYSAKIDSMCFDLLLVTHDRYITAPYLLAYTKTPTVFLCQEPTRSFYEDFLKIPIDWPVLNKLYESYDRGWRKKLEEKSAAQSTKIICNSNFSKRQIEKAYHLPAQVTYLGIDTDIFVPSNIPRKNQVLCVGNNEPQKNLHLAIESIAKIDRSIRPKLVIVGPRSSKWLPLTILADQLEVNLQILSDISLVQLIKLYQSSICTLATAILEPLGLSVLESLSCQTPVVAIAQGGFLETVDQNQDGYLVKPNSESIAQSVTRLLNSPQTRDRFGEHGRKKILKKFAWEKIILNINQVLESVYHQNHHD